MPDERKPRAKCAVAVWESEVNYDDAIKRIDNRDVDAAKYSIEEFKKALSRVEESCGINLSEEKEKADDASDAVSDGRFIDAKFSLLFSSWYMIDRIKRLAKDP
jgi:hypothetical protein